MTDLVSQLVGSLEDCLDDSHQVLAQMEQMYGTNYRHERLESQRKTIADAEAALTAAKAGGWVCASQAPKHPVCQDGNNHYSEYILAWWPGAIAPTRCRWWFRDDTTACNFVADGGYAVFPTVFQPLPAPPAQRGEG